MLNTPALPNLPINFNLPQLRPDHLIHILANRFQLAILDKNVGKLISFNNLYLKTLVSDPDFTQWHGVTTPTSAPPPN